jgi:hypothetical protein
MIPFVDVRRERRTRRERAEHPPVERARSCRSEAARAAMPRAMTNSRDLEI